MIESERLWLREWRQSDREPFAQMNKDLKVMKFLGPPRTREQSDAAVEAQIALMERGSPAFWAVERKQDAKFIGCIGVKTVKFEAPFTPCYEIGWRLAQEAWGKGYATEGANSALKLAFGQWDIKEIYSFTVPSNKASQAVMKKIGMKYVKDGDFKHPNLAENDPLSQHVLYHISRETVLPGEPT